MICLHGNHLVVTTKKQNGCYHLYQTVILLTPFRNGRKWSFVCANGTEPFHPNRPLDFVVR